MPPPGVHFAADTARYQNLLDEVARLYLVARRARRYGNGATVVALVLLVAVGVLAWRLWWV